MPCFPLLLLDLVALALLHSQHLGQGHKRHPAQNVVPSPHR